MNCFEKADICEEKGEARKQQHSAERYSGESIMQAGMCSVKPSLYLETT